YLTGSESFGISMTTLISSGGLRPELTWSRPICGSVANAGGGSRPFYALPYCNAQSAVAGGPRRDAGAGPGGRAGPGGMAGGGSRAPALGAASHGPHFAHSQGAAAISRKVHGPGAPAGGGRPPPAVRIARFPPTLDPPHHERAHCPRRPGLQAHVG